MAKGAYIGISGKARKIKKLHFGVAGKARAVKKAYVGIGGKARPWMSSEGVEYYGRITNLSVARYDLAATTVGDYALFGGGESLYNDYGAVRPRITDAVDSYNNLLVHYTPSALSAARYQLAATTIGNYALFGGGYLRYAIDNSYYAKTVDAYNTFLTQSTPTALSVARSELAATTVGNYALFAGGSVKKTVDAYNTSLTRSTPTALSMYRSDPAATTVGNYALFGGGRVSEGDGTIIDAYNASLTRSTPTGLSVARGPAATTVGNYALFGGGGNITLGAIVDAYDTSLTRSTPTALSLARSELAATTVGDYALFGGGHSGTGVSTVDAYNTLLVHSTPKVLSNGRYAFAATTVGSYALFGGGRPDNNNGYRSSVVDAYTATT